MAQIVYSRVYKELKLGRREQLLMLEIGRDQIDTASSFVEYINENYGFSKSSIWYCLNKLKELELADFANKVEFGKPLMLTRAGLSEFEKLEVNKSRIIENFSNTFIRRIGRRDSVYSAGYAKNGT